MEGGEGYRARGEWEDTSLLQRQLWQITRGLMQPDSLPERTSALLYRSGHACTVLCLKGRRKATECIHSRVLCLILMIICARFNDHLRLVPPGVNLPPHSLPSAASASSCNTCRLPRSSRQQESSSSYLTCKAGHLTPQKIHLAWRKFRRQRRKHITAQKLTHKHALSFLLFSKKAPLLFALGCFLGMTSGLLCFCLGFTSGPLCRHLSRLQLQLGHA